MRVAIIGAGFGEQHLAWLFSCPGVRIELLVYSSNTHRAERLAARFGVAKISTSPLEAVEGSADLVAVVTPVHLHAEWAERALRNGKAVVCEKPLALSVAQAEHLVQVANAVQVRAMVMFQWRFHPALRTLRDLVLSGRLGQIVHLDLQFHHDFLASQATACPWRHAPELASAGALADQAVHLFDLIRWITNDEFGVTASSSSVVWDTRISEEGPVPGRTEDLGVALLRGRTGALATVSAMRVTSGRRNLRVAVSGTAGVAWVDVSPDTTAARIDSSIEGLGRDWAPGSLCNPYRAFLASADGTAAADIPDFGVGLAAQRLLEATASGSPHDEVRHTDGMITWHR